MVAEEVPYRVAYPDAVREELKRLIDTLVTGGHRRRDLAALLREADRRLALDPTYFGEPHFHLGQDRLVVCYSYARPFGFEYAVHEQGRAVFVRRIFLLPG